VTHVIGIDVGGTKIAACRWDPATREVLGGERWETGAADGGPAVLRRCAGLARLLAADDRLPVGIALCELVDLDGAVASAETVDWRGLDVAAPFAGLGPVVLESDVRAAALAEARLGAGQGSPLFLYVSVGTGISHALVIDGRPLAGAHGSALVTGAPLVEQTASGAALARGETLERAAADLGQALAFLVNALDPERVVIGGGLGLDPTYRDLAEQAMRPLVYAETARAVPLVPALLGAEAGAVGAALRASEEGA
jgi:glucokinase